MDSRVKSAKKRIEGMVDRILDVVECRSFVEFVTVTGGDCVVYRVYNDGSIVER